MSAAAIRISVRLLLATMTSVRAVALDRHHVVRAVAAAELGERRAAHVLRAAQRRHVEDGQRRAAVAGEQRRLALHGERQERLDRRRGLVPPVRRVVDLQRRRRAPSR